MKVYTRVLAGLALSGGLVLGGLGVTASAEMPTHSTSALAHPCVAVTTYGGWGPGGATRYRAFDRYCGPNYNAGGTWYGPLRLKKATADHDRDVRNAGRN